MSLAVPQNKTISVIVQELPRKRFISITASINSKNVPASNYEYYGFYSLENRRPVTVIILGEMVTVPDA